jgi:hypothetical protein
MRVEQVAERAVVPGGGLAVEDREQRVGLLVEGGTSRSSTVATRT